MSRNLKEKLATSAGISLQIIPDTVTAADSTLEKRKKEANTPIYLKRI